MARTETATKPKLKVGVPEHRSLGHWWLAACLLVASGIGAFAPTLRTKPIEEISVGDRVAGHNPLREQVDESVPEPDGATWKRVDLRMTKSDGKLLDMSFLWSPETLAETGAKVGAAIPIDMPEMGAEGEATVLAISPAPPIKAGDGNVVTGTFKHEASEDCVNVLIAGTAVPIGSTATHPFWSEDRQDFVGARSLRPGERVWTDKFGVARVESVTPLPGQHTVYNLQIHGEHVYEVSEAGVLVHNVCKTGPKPWPNGPHNRMIQKRITQLKKALGKNWEHVGGGTKTEFTILTPDGHKSSRRLDITFRNKKTGKYYHEQVGRTLADGETPHVRHERSKTFTKCLVIG